MVSGARHLNLLLRIKWLQPQVCVMKCFNERLPCLFVLSQCVAACITLPLIETVLALESGEAAYLLLLFRTHPEVQCTVKTVTPIVCGEHPPAPVVLG